jgi:hypothetical protein
MDAVVIGGKRTSDAFADWTGVRAGGFYVWGLSRVSGRTLPHSKPTEGRCKGQLIRGEDAICLFQDFLGSDRVDVHLAARLSEGGVPGLSGGRQWTRLRNVQLGIQSARKNRQI